MTEVTSKRQGGSLSENDLSKLSENIILAANAFRLLCSSLRDCYARFDSKVENYRALRQQVFSLSGDYRSELLPSSKDTITKLKNFFESYKNLSFEGFTESKEVIGKEAKVLIKLAATTASHYTDMGKKINTLAPEVALVLEALSAEMAESNSLQQNSWRKRISNLWDKRKRFFAKRSTLQAAGAQAAGASAIIKDTFPQSLTDLVTAFNAISTILTQVEQSLTSDDIENHYRTCQKASEGIISDCCTYTGMLPASLTDLDSFSSTDPNAKVKKNKKMKNKGKKSPQIKNS